MTDTSRALRAIAERNAELERVNAQLLEAVKEARRLLHTWQEIGWAVGISRQAAWEQWHYLEWPRRKANARS
jgi:hypothetical protein